MGFDAMTQEGVHVTSKEDSYGIAIDQLPGGMEEDYEMHIIESIHL